MADGRTVGRGPVEIGQPEAARLHGAKGMDGHQRHGQLRQNAVRCLIWTGGSPPCPTLPTLDGTCAQLVSFTNSAKVARAHHVIRECDLTLRRYRAALEQGANPETVGQWINAATAKKTAAQQRLRELRHHDVARFTIEQVRELILQVGAIVDQFAAADPADRAGLHQQLGIDLVYRPTERLVVASADLRWHIERVGGGDLSTFVMISQNRTDAKHQILADHQCAIVQEEERQTRSCSLSEPDPGVHQSRLYDDLGASGRECCRRARRCDSDLLNLFRCPSEPCHALILWVSNSRPWR